MLPGFWALQGAAGDLLVVVVVVVVAAVAVVFR